MTPMLFECPYTLKKVPYLRDEDCCDPQAYEPVDCPECGKVHVINKLTGKRLGQPDR